MVSEPLEKAADTYASLGDARQLAATRYQAGTLWSRLWMRASEPRRARERLAKALGHYQAAHAYFSGAGGRTLAMIDLDLCDLYTVRYSASHPQPHPSHLSLPPPPTHTSLLIPHPSSLQAVHAASPNGNLDCLDKALLCLLETHRAFAPNGNLNGSSNGNSSATLDGATDGSRGGADGATSKSRGKNKGKGKGGGGTSAGTSSSASGGLPPRSPSTSELDPESLRLAKVVRERLPKVLLSSIKACNTLQQVSGA